MSAGSMRELDKSSFPRIREEERATKPKIANFFTFNWFDRVVTVDTVPCGAVEQGMGDCFVKVDTIGKVLCQYCTSLVDYRSRGWKSLEKHVLNSKHKKKLITRSTNFMLPAMFGGRCNSSTVGNGTTPRSAHSMTGPSVSRQLLIPISDRVVNFQALILGVLAEHSMPFTMGPVLIQLGKQLASDPKALAATSMDRTSAAYKMRFGLAETLHAETLKSLRESYFSLNMDESTSENLKRVLTILVSYYCTQSKKVIVEHLSSISLIKVDSRSIFEVVMKVMDDNEIPWDNLISVLMDSCAVMRGSKSGVEVRLREKAPQLLDIDGDSCHHIHNTVRQLCKPFEYHVEGLFGDLHNDFKWSTDLREWLEEICFLLGIKYTTPERFVSHRWLSVFDVGIGTSRMLDAYTVFYYGLLNKDDKSTYLATVMQIYHKREVNAEVRDKIRDIHKKLLDKRKTLTVDGTNRKLRIVKNLFFLRQQTILTMQFYIAVLPVFKRYVLLFEMKEPKIHKLYDEQIDVIAEFFSYFVRPELLQNQKAVKLKELDITNSKNLLPKTDAFMGAGAKTTLKDMKKGDTLRTKFLDTVGDAYVGCGKYLQTKLPFGNRLLQCVSAIDPIVRGHKTTIKYLTQLPSLVKIISEDEKESFEREIFRYQIDQTLPSPSLSGGQLVRLDVWWSHVFGTMKYPALSKIVKALISCFHGPMVEGSFNLMGDIFDCKSGRMNITTMGAQQTIKYSLRAKGISALDYFSRKDIMHDPVDVNLCRNMKGASKRYRDEVALKNEVIKQKRLKLQMKHTELESKERAKKRIKAAQDVAKAAHKKKMFKIMKKIK